MRKFIVCSLLVLSMGCASTQAGKDSVDSFLNGFGLPNWYQADPIQYEHFYVTKTKVTLMVFVYKTQDDLVRQWYRMGKKQPWGFGHGMDSGLQEAPPYMSKGGSKMMFVPDVDERRLGFYSPATNSIHYIKGDQRFTCQDEFEHAQKSTLWDNSQININEVCP